MEYKSESPNYSLTSMQATQKQIGAWRKGISDRSSTVITSQPLRSGSDFGDTSSRSSRGHLEDSFSEGGSLNAVSYTHLTLPTNREV